MASAPTLRSSLSPACFGRGLEGFRSRVASALQPSGIAELDLILGGGFPRGSMVEVCGPVSSGRTSLSLALLTQATERQEVCAVVDVSESLDPASVAAAGVDLSRLLWIRCGDGSESGKLEEASVPETKKRTKKEPLASSQEREKQGKGFYWQHPRDQIRGVERSIPSLMRLKNGRGPGLQQLCPAASSAQQITRIHAVTRSVQEQVESDRQAPRRGENVRQHALPSFDHSYHMDSETASYRGKNFSKPWKRLEQALKATDLLLHSGGWGVVVFDLGNIAWTDARRIPLSTWFRFQRTVENTPTILLLLGEHSCAKSCASVVLSCRRTHENWCSAAYEKTASRVTTLQGFEVKGEVVRSRMQLPPSDSACWQTRTIRTGSF
jgi:recombination protein RecA